MVGRVILVTKFSTLFWTARTKLLLKAIECVYGSNLSVDGKLWVWVQDKERISIGNNLKINSRFGSNLVGITNSAVFQCVDNGKITIGNNVGLSSVVLSARSEIVIGDNVKIGGNVRVFDHDYHSLDYEARRDSTRDGVETRTKPVHIGRDVFIGTNALILKGVSIGERCVIGAGSVVTCNIPPDEIWAGNPSQCVRASGAKNVS